MSKTTPSESEVKLHSVTQVEFGIIGWLHGGSAIDLGQVLKSKVHALGDKELCEINYVTTINQGRTLSVHEASAKFKEFWDSLDEFHRKDAMNYAAEKEYIRRIQNKLDNGIEEVLLTVLDV